jgi:hypothetical protein
MSVRARVTVTLEIVVSDHWGDEVRADQVRKQAIESAIGAIRRGMTVDLQPGTDKGEGRGWARVVSEPKVEAIIADLPSGRNE